MDFLLIHIVSGKEIGSILATITLPPDNTGKLYYVVKTDQPEYDYFEVDDKTYHVKTRDRGALQVIPSNRSVAKESK